MYEILHPDQENKERLLFHKRIEKVAQSAETQNINNYFAAHADEEVENIEETFYSLVEGIYLLFTDTRTPPHCKLLYEPAESRTYVDFYTQRVEEEAKINDIDYTKAFSMMQVVTEDKNRCIRFLINKENITTVLAICFDNCVWDKEKPNTLVSAHAMHSIPFVLDLVTTPTVGFVLQKFLAFGYFQNKETMQVRVSSITH